MPGIYLYRNPVDFRKSFRGLAAIVEQELGHNPFDGGLYAFTNRQRNKIKCLFWEDNGFVLYYKSLAEEKFRWPRQGDELMSLTGYSTALGTATGATSRKRFGQASGRNGADL